ncbi:MAG: PepSY-associated TM helix domain-containing protein, partial [Pseudomonadota bacterium]
MTWLHTWAGLVFCWILYFMFVTGTLGYLDLEIDRWMQETPRAEVPAPLAESVAAGVSRLEAEGAGADRWFVTPAHGRENPNLRIFWNMPPQEDDEDGPVRGDEVLSVATGAPIAEPLRETGGGQVLYRMHYLLHYFPGQTGYRLVGIITVLMFVGMITGIIIHKKIFREFFTFRPRKGQRSWLDAHNLLSVSSLPFQLMITYSGLLFTLGLWLPMIAFASFGFDAKKTQEGTAQLLNDVQIERSGTAAPLRDPVELLAVAEAQWGPDQVSQVEVRFPGDANARIILNRHAGVGTRLGDRLIFDGVSGELLQSTPGTSSGVVKFAIVMLGLHEGTFAGPLLR